jgi:hypothetical protein
MLWSLPRMLPTSVWQCFTYYSLMVSTILSTILHCIALSRWWWCIFFLFFSFLFLLYQLLFDDYQCLYYNILRIFMITSLYFLLQYHVCFILLYFGSEAYMSQEKINFTKKLYFFPGKWLISYAIKFLFNSSALLSTLRKSSVQRESSLDKNIN